MAICKNVFAVVFLAILTGCASHKQTKCLRMKLKSFKLSTELTESEATVEYTCPRDSDSKSFTECCNNESCCEPSFLSITENYESLLTNIGMIVIISCTVLTVLVVVCCFWSKCPLYNACRANYNISNIIVYSLGKDDPTPLMPAEANKRDEYHPCTVKIRKMQEV